MTRRVARTLPVLGMLLALVSCRGMQPSWLRAPDSVPDLTPTRIEYVDSDGFDGLLESALVNQDPVIIIRTGRSKPDWEGRLNAWIAAWNTSSQRRKPTRRAEAETDWTITVRGQSPLGKVDGESIREFRLLVDSLLDRAEEVAQTSATWWAEERARNRRVGILKPYSMRFHKDEQDEIQLVFFHGSFASYYSRHMQLLMKSETKPEMEWTRGVECSDCKRQSRESLDRLMSREGEE